MIDRPARQWNALTVTLLLLLPAVLLSGPPADRNRAAADSPAPYGPARLSGTLEDPAINESSGVMASRVRPGMFWTHNDSGDGPYLYLFDRQGKKRGTWLIVGASSRDAEDCAAGAGPVKGRSYLYFGDIGDNGSERTDCAVWRVPEPDIPANGVVSDRNQPQRTAPAEALPFNYPDGPHDCEALLVHPASGDVYLVTKERRKSTSTVLKFPSPNAAGQRQTLVKVAEIALGASFPPGMSLVTGADIAPDGRRVILRDYTQLYELTLPNGATSFDAVWKQTPRAFPSPELRQGEAVCYGAVGAALYLTSEQLPTPLYELPRR